MFGVFALRTSKQKHRIIKAVRLTRIYRCFGDKGDVEDITEGKDDIPSVALMPSTQKSP
jgi:hypothetical protein